MVFGDTRGVAHDAFEDFEQADDFDFEPGFFAYLAMNSVFETLAHFDDPAWQ
jgi:hypothetical protein